MRSSRFALAVTISAFLLGSLSGRREAQSFAPNNDRFQSGVEYFLVSSNELRKQSSNHSIEGISNHRIEEKSSSSGEDNSSGEDGKDSDRKNDSKDLGETLDYILSTLWKITLFSVFLFSALFLILAIISLTRKGKGTIVTPFKDFREKALEKETGKDQKQDKESLIGQAIADYLIAELHTIRQVYTQLDFLDKSINFKPLKVQLTGSNSYIDNTNLRCKILVGTPTLPYLKTDDSTLKSDIGEVSTIGPISASISIDKLVVAIKKILPIDRKNRLISGSLQDYGDSLQIVARMEQGRLTSAWKVKPDDGTKSPHDISVIPKLVERLAFRIACTFSRQSISVEHFDELIELLRAYTKCNLDDKCLNEAYEKCQKFIACEPHYIGLFGILYNLATCFLEREDYRKSDTLFRYAISLEPHLIRRVFDSYISPKDIVWSKDFWRQKFDEHFSVDVRTKSPPNVQHFQYCCLRLKYWMFSSLNKVFVSFRRGPRSLDNGRDYEKVKIWANSLAHALNGLGQSLEQRVVLGIYSDNEEGDAKQDIVLNNDSGSREDDEKIFVHLKEAEEAYKRAEQVNFKDASALTYRSSLIIENVSILRQKRHLRENLISKAEEYLKEATQKSKNVHLAYNRLGNLYRDKGDFLRAEDSYKDATRHCREFIVAYRNLGILACERKDFRKSIDYFEKGMERLSDDALFEEESCFNQWHAWLHNGMGWTYLCQYAWKQALNQTSALEDRTIDLELATHQFHEAIKISGGKMYLSLSNLGIAYGLMNPKDSTRAIKQWERSLEKASDIKGKKWKEVFTTFYEFVRSENFEINIDELKNCLKKNIPMRMCNGLLQDARMLQLCGQAKPSNIEKVIEILEGELPAFYVGMSYVWKDQYEYACNRWYMKVDSIQRRQQQKCNEAEKFCDILWKHIYTGLLWIITQEDSLDADLEEIKNKIDSQILSKQKYQDFSDLCTQLENHIKQQASLKRYRKDFKGSRNEVDEIICEVMDDAIDKLSLIELLMPNSKKGKITSSSDNKPKIFSSDTKAQQRLKELLNSTIPFLKEYRSETAQGHLRSFLKLVQTSGQKVVY